MTYSKDFYRQKFLFGKTNKDISHLLRSIAAAYMLKGENRFRIIAYQNAADAVEHLSQEIEDIYKTEKISQIPNIGPSISQNLDEYFKKGWSEHFSDILAGIPITVFELMKVRSIGPKKAFTLVQKLKLFDSKNLFSNLLNLAEKGEIAKLPGFGEKSQKEIIEAVKHYLKHAKEKQRMIIAYADKIAEEITDYLKKSTAVKKTAVLGSLRRRVETIGDIDIAVVTDNPEEVIKHFIQYPKAVKIENAGSNKASIILPGDIRIDIRTCKENVFGTMIQYFTGSKLHNIRLREYSLKKGFSISEYSIKEIKSGKKYLFSDERKIYKFLNLSYIPPEIREGEDEIEKAEKGEIPVLIERNDLKGEFHIHSNQITQSSHDQGKDSIEKLAEKALNIGYSYIGISDHNPIASLSKKKIISILRSRKDIIDQINYSKKFERLRIFNGLEVDILPDGSLPLPDKAFELVDYIIVSIHSSFVQSRSRITKRVIRALSFPKVCIFGHPTARLLNKRDGIDPDWDEIFVFCRSKDIALEINSWPQRLDLPDFLIKQARKLNCRFVINTDSHAVDHLENISYGIDMARRGWLSKSMVVNTLDLDKINQWIKR